MLTLIFLLHTTFLLTLYVALVFSLCFLFSLLFPLRFMTHHKNHPVNYCKPQGEKEKCSVWDDSARYNNNSRSSNNDRGHDKCKRWNGSREWLSMTGIPRFSSILSWTCCFVVVLMWVSFLTLKLFADFSIFYPKVMTVTHLVLTFN